jgi:4-amino-4-deoxychorismate lyase
MILVNGVATNEVSALDRGLAYGDGLFETVAVVHGEILNWPRHMARLKDGCARLAITGADAQQLFDETLAVAAGTDRSVVKISITRGQGGMGYTPPAAISATRIVARRPWPEDYAEREETGVRVRVARHRLSSNPRLAGLKHLNRLDQVLASMEPAAPGIAEAIMLDLDGRVIEATRCNLFAVYGDRLATPRLNDCGVRGVMRAIVVELAPTLDLRPEETELTLDDLRMADEVFLCNAIAGLWPVVELADDPSQTYLVGEHTRRLQAAIIAEDHRR